MKDHPLTCGVLLTLFLCSLTAPAWSQPGSWELKKEKDGIQVFLRDQDDSRIKEVRYQFVTRVPLERVISVLQDAANFPEWVYHNEEARILEASDDGSCIYYSRISFPWPLQDRDLVASSTTQVDPQTGQIRIRSVALPDYLPEEPKTVRITEMESGWILSPQPDGSILMDYRLRSDPGGSLPAWLINLAIDNGPLHSARALRTALTDYPSAPMQAVASGQ